MTGEISGLVAPNSMIPGRLRVGDINADGFPDLIITIENSDVTTSTKIYIN